MHAFWEFYAKSSMPPIPSSRKILWPPRCLLRLKLCWCCCDAALTRYEHFIEALFCLSKRRMLHRRKTTLLIDTSTSIWFVNVANKLMKCPTTWWNPGFSLRWPDLRPKRMLCLPIISYLIKKIQWQCLITLPESYSQREKIWKSGVECRSVSST